MLELSANIFKQIPDDLDYEGTVKILETDHRPINTVLLQEVRYAITLRFNFSNYCLISVFPVDFKSHGQVITFYDQILRRVCHISTEEASY